MAFGEVEKEEVERAAQGVFGGIEILVFIKEESRSDERERLELEGILALSQWSMEFNMVSSSQLSEIEAAFGCCISVDKLKDLSNISANILLE